MENYDGDSNIEPYDDGDSNSVQIEGLEESPTIIDGENKMAILETTINNDIEKLKLLLDNNAILQQA
ncbi:MAG: hypothetical protein LIO65_03725 [Odoribacter sp.]|nr:hypothetical protein [Odoribacter sp.]